MSSKKKNQEGSIELTKDRLRSAAKSHYPGTVARGTATGPDPYLSGLRRKVERGEKIGQPKQEPARKNDPGR